MYQPAHTKFVETRPEKLHALLRENPLGTLITQRGGTVEVDHVPFLLDTSGAKSETLRAHVPRANPVWRQLDSQPVLIAFHGPNAYVSPNWYPGKQRDPRVVPTWNYAVVHARGIARTIEDKTWLRAHLDALTDTHERNALHPWRVAHAPTDYVDRLLSAIVGIEVSVTQLEGKFKLGQNRPAEDQQGVFDVLHAMASPLAVFMEDKTG